jgi:hypothetical protein
MTIVSMRERLVWGTAPPMKLSPQYMWGEVISCRRGRSLVSETRVWRLHMVWGTWMGATHVGNCNIKFPELETSRVWITQPPTLAVGRGSVFGMWTLTGLPFIRSWFFHFQWGTSVGRIVLHDLDLKINLIILSQMGRVRLCLWECRGGT